MLCAVTKMRVVGGPWFKTPTEKEIVQYNKNNLPEADFKSDVLQNYEMTALKVCNSLLDTQLIEIVSLNFEERDKEV